MSEAEFKALSFSGTPRIVTDGIPGPKCREVAGRLRSLQSLTVPMSHPLVWDEAKGATVRDLDGNLYVDMMASVAVSNVGHCHPKVVEAVVAQVEKLMQAKPNLSQVKLMEKLSEIMPGEMKGKVRTAFASSGSEACELAIKFAKYHTKKFEIIAFQGAYHGHTMGAVTMTTNTRLRKGIGPLVPTAIHAPYAYCYRCSFDKVYPDCNIQCMEYVRDLIENPCTGLTDPAALIVEPILGEGGYVVPPREFLEGLSKICRDHSLIFIVDEIQTGFCRTGKMFAIENHQVTPDLLVLGKALGNDVPIAATVGKKKLMDTLGELFQPLTFSGNALCCAAAAASIDVMQKYRLHERSAHLGEYFMKSINDLAKETKLIGDVRGEGLMIGVEFVEERRTKKPLAQHKVEWIVEKMRMQGVLVCPCGQRTHVIRFMPPLIITKDLLGKAFEIFADVVKEADRRLD